MVEILFLDENYDEIESCFVNMTIEKAIEIIDKSERIAVGTDRLRCEKLGYMAVDFKFNKIDIQVKFNS